MTTKASAFLLWLVPALVAAVAIARLSVWVQPTLSPLLLYPLLVGAGLGAVLCGLLYLARFNDLRFAAAGAAAIGLVAALAEHGFFYLDYRRAFEETRFKNEQKIGPAAGEVRPAGFVDYMRLHAAAEPAQAALWIANAALMAIASAGMVVWYLKANHACPKPITDEEKKSSPRDSSQI